MKNPWTTLGSREVYKNDWIRVREDCVIRPDGLEGIYGVVETRVATGVLALTPEGCIYLVGQYRYPTKCYSWEIVEGGADEDEAPEMAARRELLEETGLAAASWIPLGGPVQLTNCHSSERGYLYVATKLTQGTAAPDGTEKLECRALPFEEALRMVDVGEIEDAMSIIAILRLARKVAVEGWPAA